MPVALLQAEPLGAPAATSAQAGAAIVRATVAANMIDNNFVFIVFSFVIAHSDLLVGFDTSAILRRHYFFAPGLQGHRSIINAQPHSMAALDIEGDFLEFVWLFTGPL